ncbi:ATP-dependent zinc metalloprotease FtsH [Pseudonocardia sp. 73-21]|uniref:ATP-dependent zinc metalloprotease FtsH n=1 Tax=Pseudonocardia sp. 73-21 TaxID=1895809 RepID=UPI000A4352FB|nr:ATP-dependent zinc metalloprotease FtsH [Pseudonocardia sp. 73-21]
MPIWLLGLVALYAVPALLTPSAQVLGYSDFVAQVTADKVATATISGTGAVSGTLVGGATYTSQVPTALADPGLAPLLAAHRVAVSATNPGATSWGAVLLSFLPYVLIIGLGLWWLRRSSRRLGAGGLGGMMGVGASKAKVYDESKPGARFADIAGYEGSKTEVMEVVDFLRNPERYRRAGAKGPKGVLMIGPPGTGKTLFARAVAGEAGVPFFSISGSGFVEMFVGVGASRVRSLFEDARAQAPSIIFIDEIDAIGGRRGSGGGFGSNDEREQTLNQLLSEMDGFEAGSGVVVIAATNRAESLDAALLRPGRFDRTVEIPLPNQAERAAILAIHARGKDLGADVDLGAVARGTPGFSGADLANLVNEAAINAVRADRDVVTAADIDAARDRLLLGRRDSSNALLPGEKRAVAVHEAGHALVAALSPHADPVAKITILPRGAALGVTEQLPLSERHLYPQSYLTDSLAVRMGGRAAEEAVLGEASTGAANDLASATELATRMVREWGLSPRLGPVGYGPDGATHDNPLGARPYAEQTQRAVDEEVARLLREAEEAAGAILRDHRDVLDRLTAVLLERETIDGATLEAIIAERPAVVRPVGSAPRGGLPV